MEWLGVKTAPTGYILKKTIFRHCYGSGHKCSCSSVKRLPQNTEADFATPVEIGVESDTAVCRRHELDPGGSDGVVWGELDDEMEEATLVGCVKWTCDQCMDLEGKRTNN